MIILRILCIAGLFVIAVIYPQWTNAQHTFSGPVNASASGVVYRTAPESISFKSTKLSAWTWQVQQQSSALIPLPTRLYASQPDRVRSLRVSASRALGVRLPQHVFASLTASPYDASDYPDWILLPSEAGRAATFGWRLGDPQQLNMAIEVKHRELGLDKELTSLTIGVQYYF